MENQTPKDRVSMHLYVQAGALLENDQEQGAAHFLEHMLFNGTTHFPPGEMIKYFQHQGFQSLFVVLFAAQYGASPVELFKEEKTTHLMGQCESGEGEDLVSSIQKFLGQT